MKEFDDYNFKTFFDSYKNKLPYLPLCHTADGYTVREILNSGKFKPTPCPVFKGKDLLYFFYGKPAYRVNDKIKAGTGAFWPVTLLLKSSNIITESIFPFDSGAFCDKKFANFFHPQMEISDFQLDNSILKVKNFIKFFYDKNDNYFFGKVLDGLGENIPKAFFELESYYELLREKSTDKVDDRDRAVEIIIDKEIVLSNKSILLAVVPSFYLDDKIFQESLQNYAETVLDYPTTKGNPGEFHGLIFDRVQKYLKMNNLI